MVRRKEVCAIRSCSKESIGLFSPTSSVLWKCKIVVLFTSTSRVLRCKLFVNLRKRIIVIIVAPRRHQCTSWRDNDNSYSISQTHKYQRNIQYTTYNIRNIRRVCVSLSRSVGGGDACCCEKARRGDRRRNSGDSDRAIYDRCNMQYTIMIQYTQ